MYKMYFFKVYSPIYIASTETCTIHKYEMYRPNADWIIYTYKELITILNNAEANIKIYAPYDDDTVVLLSFLYPDNTVYMSPYQFKITHNIKRNSNENV